MMLKIGFKLFGRKIYNFIYYNFFLGAASHAPKVRLRRRYATGSLSLIPAPLRGLVLPAAALRIASPYTRL
jgi:hypothetical protein